jgi:hypothetical protein
LITQTSRAGQQLLQRVDNSVKPQHGERRYRARYNRMILQLLL